MTYIAPAVGLISLGYLLCAGIDALAYWVVNRARPVKHLPGLEHQAGANWDLYDAAFLAIATAGIWLGLIA